MIAYRLIILMFFPVFMAGAEIAFAHKMKVFATVEHETLTGYAYYSSGARVRKPFIKILDSNGTEIQKITGDENGQFGLKLACRSNYIVQVAMPDGHRADWSIEADEFSRELPLCSTLGVGIQHPASANIFAGSSSTNDGAEKTDTALMISKEIAPLKTQIVKLQERIEILSEKKRLQDILGAIGYLFGLAGVFYYLKGRSSTRE